MTAIWDDVKNHIRITLPEKSFSLWINPLTLLEEKGGCLFLGCPNKFSQNWVTENYWTLIDEKLKALGYGDYSFSLNVMPKKRTKVVTGGGDSSPQLALPHIPRKNEFTSRPLNSEFTFDRFVVGKCNEFAFSAAKALAHEGALPSNSLFMLSKTGLGKSHLSQATGQAILQMSPQTRVHYMTAEDFVNEMIFSLKNNQIDEFKNKYRKRCDVLLLEEIHFLGGKEKTQLELAYTLDALLNSRKRIMFTSSLLPKDIPNLNKELSSRLTSGIITTLSTPDYQTRVKILQSKANEQALTLSDEIISLLAEHLTGDIRQMESALRCLKAKSDLLKERITLDLAEEVLKTHIPLQDTAAINHAQNLVCKYFKVDPLILRSKSRKKIHSYPRNVYIYLCRHYTGTTVEEIGKSVNRSHSTVVYAYEAIERKMKVDQKVNNQVLFLGEKLRDMTK